MARKKKTIDYDMQALGLAQYAAAKPTFDFASETIKYYNILFELYATTFKWKNLPFEIIRDGGELFLEKLLCSKGSCLFYYDDVLKEYLVQEFVGYGVNQYRQPLEYQVISVVPGYNKRLTRENAVACYNSPYYTGEINTIHTYAEKLALCDMTLTLNLQAQKTPYIIQCADGQRQTLINLLKQVEEFQTAVFATDTFDENALTIYPLNAPFIADKVYDVKNRIWKEALNFAGTGFGSDKRERQNVLEEVNNESYRFSMLETRLTSRKIFCEQVNKMFGLNIDVELREDLQLAQANKYTEDMNDKEGGVVNE